MQSSLDQAMGRLYGESACYDWRLIENAIGERADSFPEGQHCEGTTASQRRADALDSNPVTEAPSQMPLLTVFVDTRTKTDDPNPIVATIESGARVGDNTIERILCRGAIETIGTTENDACLDVKGVLGRVGAARRVGEVVGWGVGLGVARGD